MSRKSVAPVAALAAGAVCVLGLAAPRVPEAAAPVETVAIDRAQEALAQRDPGAAARILAQAVPKVRDPDARSRVQCLLGAALLRDHQPAAAERALRDVPLDTVCGRRAAFLAAEAAAASDPARAAAALEVLGEAPLGPDRDGQTAEAIATFAARILIDPDRGASVGLQVLDAALSLRIAPERAARFARTYADRVVADAPDALRASTSACAALLDAVSTTEDRADRLRAARVCDPSAAAVVLTALPDDDPDALWVRGVRASEPVSRALLWARALPGTAAADRPDRTLSLANGLVGARDLGGAALLADDGRVEALTAVASAWSAARQLRRSVAAYDRLLDGFPADPGRSTHAEAHAADQLALARLLASQGSADEAIATYDAYLSRHADADDAPSAALEAGLVERAAGHGDAAARRWQELAARWPGSWPASRGVASLARQRAFDGQGDLAAAKDLLRSMRQQGAVIEMDRLTSPGLWIETEGRTARGRAGRATVRLGTRNLDRVELRVHRIDLEAYVRSGGSPAGLAQLDVAPIAPDRTAEIEVPNPTPGVDRVFDVPAPVPGPGLYAVTVASDEEEARAMLLVSDLALVARAVGTDVAVATFDADGAPVPRARVLVVGPGGTTEGRTDGTGLWTASLASAGSAVVLAEHGGSWAVAELEVQGQAAVATAFVQGELERAVVLDGDHIGVRAVARSASGAPLVGVWTVWVGGGLPTQVTSDRAGVIAADLAVPAVQDDAYAEGMPARTQVSVFGVPPGEASPTVLGTVGIVPRDHGGRSLRGWIDGQDAVFELIGADGEPIASTALTSAAGPLGDTDEHGQLRVTGPRAGVPWTLVANVAGTALSARASRTPPEARTVALSTPQDRLRPAERPELSVTLDGPDGKPRRGAVVLRVARRVTPDPLVDPPEDPWVEEPTLGLTGWTSWSGPGPAVEPRSTEPTRELTVEVDGRAAVDLGELGEGEWVATAIPWDGVGNTASMLFTVAPRGLRVVGAHDTGFGEVLSLGPDGTAALVTAESDRMLFAAVLDAGRRASVQVDERWRDEVTVAATAPDGQVAVRAIRAEPTLKVTLTTAPDPSAPGAYRVRAEVRDRAGHPVAANVALTGWDERVARVVGVPAPLSDGWSPRYAEQNGAIGAELRDGATGEPIAPALLAEAARQRERAKALEATASGLLSDNALAEAMLQPGLMGGGVGGGASMGTLGGASGYGRGGGAFGEGGIGVAGRTGLNLPGVRERVLWAVLDTGPDGVAEARLVGPPAHYDLRASAISGRALGVATGSLDATDAVWWVVHEPSPGVGGDAASPYVTVINGRARAVDVTLRAGTEQVAAQLAPHSARAIAVGPALPPGPGATLLQLTAEGTALSASWRFPLAAGRRSADGPLTVVAIGGGGRSPAGWVAQRPDPREPNAPWRAAIRGRAALAAWATSRDPALAEGIRDTYLRARKALDLGPSPSEAALILLFVAEARSAGVVDVPASVVDQVAQRVGAPQSATDRAWVVRARIAAGLPVDPNLVAVLEADMAVDGPAAALVASAVRAAGRPVPATVGAGSAYTLAADRRAGRAVDPAALLAVGPPDPGDPELPEWITAVGGGAAPRRTATVSTPTIATNAGPIPVDTARGGIWVIDGPVSTTGEVWSWRAASPALDGEETLARRVPLDGSGRLAGAPSGDEPRDPVSGAGGGCDPCRLAVGDALGLPWAEFDAVPTGLVLRWWDQGFPALVATVPGRFTVTGGAAGASPYHPVTVEVTEAEPSDPLSADFVLARAGAAIDAGRSPEVPDLGPSLAAEVARLRFRAALASDDDQRIGSAFRALAATVPTDIVALSDLARAARALRASGDPVGAIRAWRAGLDAAFAAEAGAVGDIEDTIGPLAAVQRVREAALRYPDGPATGDALYLLPARLLALADEGLPSELVAAGISNTDVRLTAAAWDREFLAYYPDHERASSAGVRLARVLLALGAPEPAAAWANRVATSHPDEPWIDGLVYLEALARTEAGDSARAERLLQRLINAPFPDADGVPAPSVHRGDALVVMARLYEGRGQIGRALQAYDEAPGSAEAQRARDALQRSELDVPQIVRAKPAEPIRMTVQAANVDTVRIRAYHVDLRTLFLRDGGLSGATEVAVAGVSPSWSGDRALAAGPFPVSKELVLPLVGSGAWLVQLEGRGIVRSTLVVRSALQLAVADAADGRRVTVRRGGLAARGIEVRALAGGEVFPAVTDVRGVAEVPLGAAVLAWDGDAWAFTDPDPAGNGGTEVIANPVSNPEDERGLGPLLQLLDDRVQGRRSEDAQEYLEQFGAPAKGVKLNAL